MAGKEKPIEIEAAGRAVRITSPSKIYFPDAGLTKLDIVRYYQAVGEGAVRGVHGRPFVMKRFVKGITKPAFFQKRAPKSRPDFIETVVLSFPSGRTAEEIVIEDLAALLYCVNLGCIDLNPHAIRASDLDHPDELRVDLDPGPGVGWDTVRKVAMAVRETLDEHGLVGWPKTSGSRGIHVNVRIEPRWSFTEVRRAAIALARDVERRVPELSTSKWWKEERHGVFLDYNQNAKDRTVASAYSVRPVAAATVSAPLTWDEVPTCELADFTVDSMKTRYAEIGDLTAGIDEAVGSLESLLALSAEHEAEGMGDAPWPPHYQKQAGEPKRVQPSRDRDNKSAAKASPTGRRKSKMPLIVIARAETKDEALAGLDRWKQRHPDAASYLLEADILVDGMRGRSSLWYRIRLNLRNVPDELRPAGDVIDPDLPEGDWRLGGHGRAE